MTCIIGLVHEGKVYMGADSAISNGWSTREAGFKKVFRNGPFLIGCSGSIRMNQILHYHLAVREQEADESDEQYMVVAFVEAVRECLKDKGFTRVNSNNEELPGGSFLVGYRGHLYHVEGDLQVNQVADAFDADGSGYLVALGAMEVLADLEPEARIQRALEAAAKFTIGVSGPYHIEVLAPEPPKVDLGEKARSLIEAYSSGEPDMLAAAVADLRLSLNGAGERITND